jgi:dihydroorotate dehydrogenase
MGLFLLLMFIIVLLIFLWGSDYLPEFFHSLAVFGLRVLPDACIPNCAPKSAVPVDCMGLHFRNRVGLAAGWDKQAQCLSGLQRLGFGFVEIGGVTPKPQPGNSKPRVFRLSKHRAIINRYGLNSHGVEVIVKRLAQFERKGMLVGANLAPNTSTLPEEWLSDYRVSLRKLYPWVDYFTINVSCPNTGHIASQQSFELLDELMAGIRDEADSCAFNLKQVKRPLLIKISADLSDQAIVKLKEMTLFHRFEGIIAVNTTTRRNHVEGHKRAFEQGGLSGRPLYHKMRHTVHLLSEKKPSSLTLVAVGGIENKLQVNELLDEGVSLIQIYTRFAYRGPKCLGDLL